MKRLRQFGGWRTAGACLGAGALVGALLAGAAGAPAGASQRSAKVHHGGSLTVLESTSLAGSWTGLDPATDTGGAADSTYMDAIYGELFQLEPGSKTVGDLATGYKFVNGGKTVEITLRKGVTFSDGTPFDAAAVVMNWKRDLVGNCTCKPTFAQKQPPVIRQLGRYRLSITLTYVNAAFIDGLQGDIFNWIISPTALHKMGEKAFSLKPVGAGPFTVTSDIPSSQLALKANPRYWQKGHPYLHTLVFKTTPSDESALEAMEAGSAQAYEGMSTPQLVPAFKKRFTLTTEPSTSPYGVQLNTAVAPFNNLKAREAVYDATDAKVLDAKLFGDASPVVESFTAPAGLFYEKKVPGYRTYDLAKARALVRQLGGLTVNMFAINVPTALSLMEGLQTEWQAAGMKVTIHQYDLPSLIGQYQSKKWEATLEAMGSFDPAAGVGVSFRYASNSPFSGVHDPHLDALFAHAAATTNTKARQRYYNAAAAYIAKKAYSPFLFPLNGYDVAAHGVTGPGLSEPIPATVATEVLWQDVAVSR